MKITGRNKNKDKKRNPAKIGPKKHRLDKEEADRMDELIRRGHYDEEDYERNE